MILKNTLVNVKKNLLSIYKIIALIFLLWIFHPFDEADTFNKYLGKEYETDGTLKLRFNRLLAKNETVMKLEQAGLKEKKISDYKKNKVIKNNGEDISSYAHLKKGTSNPLDVYKKGFKNRYARKKGFAKLECYCENKLFNRIDELYKLADSMKKEKSSFKKALTKKYRLHIRFIILIFILGAITTISDTILDKCGVKPSDIPNYEEMKHFIQTIGDILVYVFPTILLLLTIYISIKYLQYESIKAGRGKMNKKEYFKYCKEVFNLKK
ncbi:Plasmodium exported protein, unknown function [Plasmodium vivax]|uniref:Variable surface protein Vir35 n=1 Tax=Plasmodium vivax TaxID=5855 RepID=A0A1G4GRS2_PLAVI|nr:Plasmodium exported protein, unknown function [Plasmodium vivax]